MRLSDLSIRNPVFAVMLSAAMIIFGWLGYREMGISQFPEIDFPVVSVTTYWDGAAPETMELDVTDVIEDAVSNVEGIDYITSQSLQGVSVVTVTFLLHRNIDVAMQDVQNAVGAAMSRLPTGVDPPIDPPVVSKINFNKYPVIWLSVHGHRPLAEIQRFVDDQLKQQIEAIPGCGGIMYGGLRRRNMRIWLDGEKLQSYRLDAVDVMQALRRQHVEKPAGYLQSDWREINVRVMGEAQSVEQFRRIPIVERNGVLLRLEDVAVVEDGLEDRRTFARFNREPNIGIGVMRATGANVVQVCTEVKQRLPALRRMLPHDMEISISTDYSLFIQEDIAEVKRALLYGIVLTAVVTFLFLGSFGSTLNVCISIPTSLMGTFFVMHWMGFTVNFMTLLALSLSVGVVVDDAILVLENIHRRCELGEPKRQAAIDGAREISFAALAATLAIAAIFIPVAFMSGAVGRFFFQFAISVSVAVLLSLVVSLTITPMLCSLFLTVRRLGRPCPPRRRGLLGPVWTLLRRGHWAVDRWVLEPLLVVPMNRLMDRLGRWYHAVLRHSLRHPWIVMPAGLVLAAAALVFAFGLNLTIPWPASDGIRLTVRPIGQELVPSEDQNRFVMIIVCPVGSSVDYVDGMLSRCEDVLVALRDPEGREVVAGFFAAISIRPGSLVSEGTMFVRLLPADQRSWTQTQVMNEVRRRLSGIPGMRVIALDLSTQGFTSTRGYPINFAVQGPDWDKVIAMGELIRQRLIDSGMVTDVNSDYRPGMPEVRVLPDKDKMSQHGVSASRLAFNLNVAVGGVRVGRFTDPAFHRRYDVRLRYLEDQRASPDQLDHLFVKNTMGRLIPLQDVTRRTVASTLPVVVRYNHMRKIELTANVAPGVSQGEAIDFCERLADGVRDELALPPSYHIVQLGNARVMQETMVSLWWCLALGFVIAAMILGVQFNSFIHPFTVLLAVPFGVTGALATLWATRLFRDPPDTLNMMSMIGLVLLAGLVKKNSIVLVDYTNQLRYPSGGREPPAQSLPPHPPCPEGKRGKLTAEEAVLQACPVRLRPILMTSLATIAAAAPLAFGIGPGAETRAPLARSIIGGIILSTLVTLVIVPCFYVLFDRFGSWVRTLARRDEPGPGEESVTPRAPEAEPEPAAATTRNGEEGLESAEEPREAAVNVAPGIVPAHPAEG
jgi:HAE1 family hydrophobic/amphiphilic exporter-1